MIFFTNICKCRFFFVPLQAKIYYITAMKKLLILFGALLIMGEVMYAQEIIVKNDGSVINAYRTDYSGSVIYYQTEDTDTGAIFRLKKEDVLVIRFADGTAITPNTAQPAQAQEQAAGEKQSKSEESAFPDIDLTDYHGFLLDKGNCVYVTYNNNVDYEVAAVDAIKKAIKANGLWTVVDKPSQAHFVLQYNVCLVGRDLAYFLLRQRDSYQQKPYLELGGWSNPPVGSYFMSGAEYVSEEVPDNVNAAQSVIAHILQNYKNMVESAEFMESVKTGQLNKSKGNKEKWYVFDAVTMRIDASKAHIKKLHDMFYK